MKKGLFQTLSTIFYGLGLLFFMLSVTFYAGGNTKAAPKSYNMSYDVTSWRNVRASSDATHYTNWLTIGPAAWRIRCTAGECNNLNENWSAYFNSATVVDGCGINFQFENSTNKGTSSAWGTGGQGSDNFNWVLFGSGLYGAMAMETQAWSNVYKCQWKATHSWPSAWQVSGTIGS